MRRLLAALAFLTRLPVPGAAGFNAEDVGRGALAFPAVGALLGGLMAAAALALHPALPSPVVALLLLALSALLTGALHLDGLADMADGFGGGRTKEDVLRIMRDHLIGAYGAVALVLGLGLKAAAIAHLLPRADAACALVVAPVLSRWASVCLSAALPYARSGAGLGHALTDHVRGVEVAGASAFGLGLTLWLAGPARGAVLVLGVAALSALLALWCRERIGGITGDTLGANTEASECLVWVVWLASAVRA
jgi:cobalamin 5'-phosphate synthase/cobalamin synthase